MNNIFYMSSKIESKSTSLFFCLNSKKHSFRKLTFQTNQKPFFWSTNHHPDPNRTCKNCNNFTQQPSLIWREIKVCLLRMNGSNLHSVCSITQISNESPIQHLKHSFPKSTCTWISTPLQFSPVEEILNANLTSMEVQLWSSKLDLKTAEGKRKPGSTSTSSSTLVMSMPVIQNEHNICPGSRWAHLNQYLQAGAKALL